MDGIILKGRLSIKWREAEEDFYLSNPITQHSVSLTGQVWMRRLIQALTGMMLEMWSHHCGCLHGHTKSKQKLKIKEALGRVVERCYHQRHTVDREHHDIFAQLLDQMLSDHNSEYLNSWISMFYLLQRRQQNN